MHVCRYVKLYRKVMDTVEWGFRTCSCDLLDLSHWVEGESGKSLLNAITVCFHHRDSVCVLS